MVYQQLNFHEVVVAGAGAFLTLHCSVHRDASWGQRTKRVIFKGDKYLWSNVNKGSVLERSYF